MTTAVVSDSALPLLSIIPKGDQLDVERLNKAQSMIEKLVHTNCGICMEFIGPSAVIKNRTGTPTGIWIKLIEAICCSGYMNSHFHSSEMACIVISLSLLTASG